MLCNSSGFVHQTKFVKLPIQEFFSNVFHGFLGMEKTTSCKLFLFPQKTMARNGHHEGGRHGAQTTLQDVLYIFQLQRVIAERQALESLNRKLVPWKQISSC